MKINNFNNFLFFQKKLVARGAVKKDGETSDVKIYQFDSDEDFEDFDRAQKNPIWKNNYYLEGILNDPNFINPLDDIYTIEDKDGTLLCYSVVDNKRAKKVELNYIETAPKISCYNSSKRGYQWVGETMIAFLAKVAGKRKFFIPKVASRGKTENFYYKNCKFTPLDKSSAYMKPSEYNALLSRNEQHTGKIIEMIG